MAYQSDINEPKVHRHVTGSEQLGECGREKCVDAGKQQIDEAHPEKESGFSGILRCEQSAHHNHQPGLDAKHGNQ